MFQIINGVITGQQLVQEMFKSGFEHMGEDSIFNMDRTIIYTARESANSESFIWRLYSYEDNPGVIKKVNDPNNKDGSTFIIGAKAKEFASLSTMDGFIQIDVGNKSFNQLKAIQVFLNFYQ